MTAVATIEALRHCSASLTSIKPKQLTPSSPLMKFLFNGEVFGKELTARHGLRRLSTMQRAPIYLAIWLSARENGPDRIRRGRNEDWTGINTESIDTC